MAKTANKDTETKELEITLVEFVRENGVQVTKPNGKFLRFVKKNKNPGLGMGSANDSDYHIVGIKEVIQTPTGLAIQLEKGEVRHFPFSQISNYTVE